MTRVPRQVGAPRFHLLWWACEHPEQPPDVWVLWHMDGCRGCRIKLHALAHEFPDDEHVTRLVAAMR